MHRKAINKYFWDINMFNIPFSLIIGYISGYLWSIVIFSTFGIIIGLLGFHTFKKNEYYAYYNLGFTKANLIKKVWIRNLIISAFVFLIYLILS